MNWEVPSWSFDFFSPTPHNEADMDAAMKAAGALMSDEEIEKFISDDNLKQLHQEVNEELGKAFKGLSLKERAVAIADEVEALPASMIEKKLGPGLQRRVDKLMEEFMGLIRHPETAKGIKEKLLLLAALSMRMYAKGDNWEPRVELDGSGDNWREWE